MARPSSRQGIQHNGDISCLAVCRMQYCTSVSHGGRAAGGLELAKSCQPAAITLDVMMPVMDGFEFMEVLRQKPECAHLPVVVITAKDLTEEDRGRLQGRVASIFKKGSIDRNRLLADISRLVAASAAATH